MQNSNVSRDSFDEKKQYDKVVFQQGMNALLDNELNELQDILVTRDERLIQSIIGDVCVADGFKIVESNPTTNNFMIKAGTMFFKDKILTLASDITYNSQGVPALTTPTGSNRTDIVYLKLEVGVDISETDDSSILNGAFGETTHRRKNKWTILVNQGSTTVPADSGNIFYIKLATINRLSGNSAITTTMIVDNRSVIKLNALKQLLSDLASTVINLGASLVGINDVGNHYTGTNVEVALQEEASNRKSHENNVTSIHGATSNATASRLIIRDANGRAKIAAPSASEDIARKDTVDSVQTNLTNHIGSTGNAHGVATTYVNGFMLAADKSKLDNATNAATANTVMLRDSSGRAKVAAPSSSDDIARKDTVDSAQNILQNNLNSHTNATTGIHGAVSTATASKLMIRDASGRAQVASPNADADIATKQYIDTTALLKATATVVSKLAIQDTNGSAKSGSPVSSTTSSDTLVLKEGVGISLSVADKTITITATGGTAPASHASTHLPGGADAIADVTTSKSGLMPATDKVKFNNATNSATASTLMLRDANGRAKVAVPSASDDIARKDTVDAVQTSLSNHTGNTNNPHGVTAAQVGAAASSHSHGAADLPSATTSVKGVVQLSAATDSTNATLAATPSAVKLAYDLANHDHPYAPSSHVTDKNNPHNVTVTQIGAVANTKGTVPSLQSGADTSKPSAGNTGNIYFASDTKKIYRDSGVEWIMIGGQDTIDWANINGKPSTFTPTAHAHLAGDLPSASTTDKGIVQLSNSVSSTSTTMAATSNAVKDAYDIGNHNHPYAASVHQHGGSDVTSKVSSASAADSVPWSGVTSKPSTFTATAHADSHKGGGSDAIAVATTSMNGLMSSVDKSKLDSVTAIQLYAADETELSITGTTATTIKSHRVVKSSAHGFNITKLHVIAELRSASGTAYLDVYEGATKLLTLSTSSSSYALLQGDCTVSWAEGTIHNIDIKLRSSGSSTVYNRLYEMYVE